MFCEFLRINCASKSVFTRTTYNFPNTIIHFPFFVSSTEITFTDIYFMDTNIYDKCWGKSILNYIHRFWKYIALKGRTALPWPEMNEVSRVVCGIGLHIYKVTGTIAKWKNVLGKVKCCERVWSHIHETGVKWYTKNHNKYVIKTGIGIGKQASRRGNERQSSAQQPVIFPIIS